MKKFVRSLPGKTILFVLCIISACVLTLSVAGMVFFLEDDLYFYTKTEQDITDEVVTSMVDTEGSAVLWRELAGYTYRSSFEYNVKIRDHKTHELISEWTDSVWNTAADCPLLTYSVIRNRNGSLNEIYYKHPYEEFKTDGEYYEVLLSPITGTSAALKLELVRNLLHIAYSLRYFVYLIAFAALIVMITCFIALMYASGRKNGTDEFVPGAFDKVPYDVLLLLGGGLVFAGIYSLCAEIIHDLDELPAILIVMILYIIGLCVLLGLCMSAAGRLKRHAFLKNTVIYHICRLLWKGICFVWSLIKKFFVFVGMLIKNIPLVWKTVLGIFIVTLFEIIAITSGEWDAVSVCWTLEKLILVPFFIYIAILLKKLQKGGAALAAGNLSYHTDTKGMPHDFKQHGENLNSIANGMSIAVEDRLKSERMKTVLITNVSHDIKTPLTSVINSSNLIAQEQCDNPKIAEYTEVLLRQSEKLKRLIEDLVEASKASTGNLEVVLAPCDASVFLSQASGEYEEKLKNSDLTLITKQPEKELRILADGRRMWRIFDNLMNNICKYSLPGTRVYLSLEEQNGKAVITFKNTSREPLDMSEEELMERFTRGDSSRNTEGNGLGLSIAKSMAELQNGHLRLDIDGDLFKAILSFPLV